MSNEDDKGRVLSIQSHVVSGYVGNKAAVFPLQVLGYDVDVINSVNFSNHTGYPEGVKGDVLDGKQLQSLLEGLKDNDLLNDIEHILTGYIGSASFLRTVIQVVHTVRKNKGSAKVRYVCDPVLGDHGEFYVPEELVKVYKDEVLPIADVVTPNQFEVEKLTGVRIRSIEDACLACEMLHTMGPGLVFITSLEIKDEKVSRNGVDDNGDVMSSIAILASERKRTKDGVETAEVWRIDSPLFPGVYTGTGDLCASLLLAWTNMENNNLQLALEKVVGTMTCVIRRTFDKSRTLKSNKGSSPAFDVLARELQLIKSKADIENAPTLYTARKIC